MIELNAQQRAAIAQLRERWCRIGLCTDAADRDAAERAIADAYRAARLPAVPQIVWCGSPRAVALARAAALASRPEELGRPVSGSVWDGSRTTRRVRQPLLSAVTRALAPASLDELRAQLESRVRLAVWESVWAELPLAAWDEHEIWRVTAWELISAHEQLGTLAVIDYLREACGIDPAPAHDAALRLARAAGWALGYERLCWVSERPSLLRLDGQERLHCPDGPALVFPDGWQVYFWRGAHVPAEWIERRSELAPSLALTWRNAEQRRVLAEIIGWERVLAELPTREIDRDRDPEIGTLLECELPREGRSRFLRVRCATGRTFVLAVPPHCATARQANAWTYGLESNDYTPEVRT